ncbi:MAG: sigma-54 dependent transcriptional regulator, partial [Planctomycetes bacterium]|nr:sigma-54 dependent transcriptional regulator [Planctomycetota bacterium]
PWTTMKSFGSDSLGLIRSEIACGNHLAARRLLEGRRALGNRHWIDDLFFARIERLAGNAEAAARHFAAMLHSAEFFGSQGRVDFELGLACELTPTAVGRLYREASAVRDTAAFLDAQAGDGEGQASPVGSGAAAHLVGASPALRGVRSSVARFAPLDATVLVTGETGTGKELVARALHEAGPRRGQPFVAVNCGAIAESLLESELFGHERGAFTGAARAHAGLFEQAGRGTIFLDEIGEVAPRLQVALLRVLETGEFRPVGATRSRRIACRVIAATNADLERLAAGGGFRADLLYRLKGLCIHLPPLRERPEDVLPLLAHFLSAERAGRPQVAPEIAGALRAYPWPGNVRELRSVADLFRVLNAGGAPYGPELLELVLPKAKREACTVPAAPPSAGISAGSSAVLPAQRDAQTVLFASRAPWRQLDRLRELFKEHGKLNRTEAAQLLGVAPKTATAYLKALCAEGAVEKRTPTPSPRSHHFVWCG